MQDIGCRKHDLDTPCLMIDLDTLDKNMKLVHEATRAVGKNVRPHAKTHKCSTLARKQLEAGAVGVCAAKVSEAEALVAAGVSGILITCPLSTPRKVERFVSLLGADPTVMVVVDHIDGVRLLDRLLRTGDLTASVLIDLDVGLGRTGVSVEEAAAFAGQLRDLPSLRVKGVQAYAGHLQHVSSYDQRARASRHAMRRAADVFESLRREGFSVEILSGAGTGTYDADLAVPELTELQVGSYVLMDVEYMDIGGPGGRRLGDSLRPSLTLLTSVISANQKGFVTVDAGLKSLYQHGGIPRVVSADADKGYSYDWFGDEQGKILFPETSPPPKLGTVLELAVSHCDPTVNLFDHYYVTRDDKLVDVWDIDLRGKSQ